MTEPKENSGYRYSATTRKRLRMKAAEMDCSIQAVIDAAVEAYLDSQASEAQPNQTVEELPIFRCPAGDIPVHQQLQVILDDPDERPHIEGTCERGSAMVKSKRKGKKSA